MPPASAAPFYISVPEFLPLAACHNRAVCLLFNLETESFKATIGEVYSGIFNLTTECVWKAKLRAFQNILSSPPFELFSGQLFTFNPQTLSLIPMCLFT